MGTKPTPDSCGGLNVHAAFDDLIHAPNRLRISAALSTVMSADFSSIRDALGISDSVLSKHLKPLSEVGYIDITKTVIDSHVRTSLALTIKGRKAYQAHIEALRQLTADAGQNPAAAGQVRTTTASPTDT
jgi:DNA-binding MarR family transcriptional regulator